MNYIKSKDNKKLKYMRHLHQKKFRDQENKYIVEGVRAISDIIDVADIDFILVENKCFEKTEFKTLINKCKKKNIQYFIIDESIEHKIELTETPQGVWASVYKQAINFETYIKHFNLTDKSDEIYLLLDKIQDPGNLGTIIRSALATGVKAIFLTKGSVDPYNPKTVRSAMSALEKISIIPGLTISDTTKLLNTNHLTSYALTPYGAKEYSAYAYEQSSLLILGNEGNGISQEIINKSDFPIIIPMYGDIESLNLSVAAALALYKVKESKIARLK